MPKARTEFHNNASAKDGKARECKPCNIARASLWQRTVKRTRMEALAGRPCPKLCEVCSCESTDGKALAFDHDHTTHEFRGWLCKICNMVLGMCKDDPDMLRERGFHGLALYIEAYRASHLARGSPN